MWEVSIMLYKWCNVYISYNIYTLNVISDLLINMCSLALVQINISIFALQKKKKIVKLSGKHLGRERLSGCLVLLKLLMEKKNYGECNTYHKLAY